MWIKATECEFNGPSFEKKDGGISCSVKDGHLFTFWSIIGLDSVNRTLNCIVTTSYFDLEWDEGMVFWPSSIMVSIVMEHTGSGIDKFLYQKRKY